MKRDLMAGAVTLVILHPGDFELLVHAWHSLNSISIGGWSADSSKKIIKLQTSACTKRNTYSATHTLNDIVKQVLLGERRAQHVAKAMPHLQTVQESLSLQHLHRWTPAV